MNKIINKLTGEIYVIKQVDTQRNIAFCDYQKDSYSQIEKRCITLLSFSNNAINAIVVNDIISEKQDFVKSEDYIPIWEEPLWNNRVYIDYKTQTKIAFAYPDWINILKSDPENPIYSKDNGDMFYLAKESELPSDIRLLLESFGLTIENNPNPVYSE